MNHEEHLAVPYTNTTLLTFPVLKNSPISLIKHSPYKSRSGFAYNCIKPC